MSLWAIPVVERYSIMWVFLAECAKRNTPRRNLIVEDMIYHIMSLPEKERYTEMQTLKCVSTQCAQIFKDRHTFEKKFTDELHEVQATLLGTLAKCLPLDEQQTAMEASPHFVYCQDYVRRATQHN